MSTQHDSNGSPGERETATRGSAGGADVFGWPAWRVLAVLPLVGYALVMPYTAVVYAFVETAPYPLVWIGSVELLVAVVYVAVCRRDRATSGWSPDARLWYPIVAVGGGTIVAAPLVVALYLRRRRQATGVPAQSWLAIARSTLR